jgi:hypothetical protein
MANHVHGYEHTVGTGGLLDLDRCRELGFKIIEVVGGYSYPEVLYILQELAKMIGQDAGGILFKREK